MQSSRLRKVARDARACHQLVSGGPAGSACHDATEAASIRGARRIGRLSGHGARAGSLPSTGSAHDAIGPRGRSPYVGRGPGFRAATRRGPFSGRGAPHGRRLSPGSPTRRDSRHGWGNGRDRPRPLIVRRFANVRFVWLRSRDDATGNVAVVPAAGIASTTGSGWPGLAVAAVMASLSLGSAARFTRQSWGGPRGRGAGGVAVGGVSPGGGRQTQGRVEGRTPAFSRRQTVLR